MQEFFVTLRVGVNTIENIGQDQFEEALKHFLGLEEDCDHSWQAGPLFIESIKEL